MRCERSAWVSMAPNRIAGRDIDFDNGAAGLRGDEDPRREPRPECHVMQAAVLAGVNRADDAARRDIDHEKSVAEISLARSGAKVRDDP